MARARPDVDDAVGVRHDRLMVLDHDHALARVDDAVEHGRVLRDQGFIAPQVDAGVAEQGGILGLLGLGLLQLSSPVLTRMALRQFARPLMQSLADLTEGQVQLGVGHKRELCLVELANGMGNSVYRPEIGVRMSLSRTATGRAYLLGMADDAREAYLQDLQASDPQRAAWLAQRLVNAREDMERHGFCRSHGDLHSEIESIAVPMSQPQDGELWIFAVSVPVFSPLYDRLESDLGPRLRTLVRSVEAIVGAGVP